MRHVLGAILACLLLACLVPAVRAQQRPILSPRDSVFLGLNGDTISVNYGRPSIRGRKIMGGLVPWNQVWRTGANEATHLKTSFDMTFGGVPVPRGRYTLWTLPSPTRWIVIVNKQTGQWGTRYDPSLDLARFEAHVEQTSSVVDTFTITLTKTATNAGTLGLKWENTLVSVPFKRNDKIRPLSPPDSSEIVLGGKNLEVKYSKPSVRGRAIWGVVVPYDSVWRTGANATTTLTTETDVTIGGVHVPKGAYTLYSIPSASGLTLIISKKQRSNEPAYDSHADLARISMRLEKPPETVDPFRIWFERSGPGSATLKIGWADKSFAAQVTAE
jgi:hypothetical protein